MKINIYEITLHYFCKGDSEHSFDKSDILATNAEEAVNFSREELRKNLVTEQCVPKEDIEFIRLEECKCVYEDVNYISPELIKIIKENY